MHNIITDNEPERNDESPVDATKLHSSLLHLAQGLCPAIHIGQNSFPTNVVSDCCWLCPCMRACVYDLCTLTSRAVFLTLSPKIRSSAWVSVPDLRAVKINRNLLRRKCVSQVGCSADKRKKRNHRCMYIVRWKRKRRGQRLYEERWEKKKRKQQKRNRHAGKDDTKTRILKPFSH